MILKMANSKVFVSMITAVLVAAQPLFAHYDKSETAKQCLSQYHEQAKAKAKGSFLTSPSEKMDVARMMASWVAGGYGGYRLGSAIDRRDKRNCGQYSTCEGNSAAWGAALGVVFASVGTTILNDRLEDRASQHPRKVLPQIFEDSYSVNEGFNPDLQSFYSKYSKVFRKHPQPMAIENVAAHIRMMLDDGSACSPTIESLADLATRVNRLEISRVQGVNPN